MLVGSARGIVIAVAFTAMLIEMPKHMIPFVGGQPRDTLYVIGDSISAGIDQDELVWPTILARTHRVQVVNLSRPGACLASILPQADRIQPGPCIVLLEIGGNDLLGKATVSNFESALKDLLRSVCGTGRTVAMLELPLPPFCAGFGKAQRRLAKRFGVTLIPKRLFAKVLTGRGNTTDGLHLSAQGHQRMADAIWRVIGGT